MATLLRQAAAILATTGVVFSVLGIITAATTITSTTDWGFIAVLSCLGFAGSFIVLSVLQT